jgi:hypothetical protein
MSRPHGAKAMLWLHGGLTVFWIVLWIVASITGWVESVVFVSHLSIVALVLASAGGWQGARAEAKAEADNGD